MVLEESLQSNTATATFEVLRAENISKSFPGVQAVDNVSLSLGSGEILALVGENGAGKSTLTQVLGGAQKPDSGRILMEGRQLSFNSSADAIQAGISMVFQELSLVGSLSVAENIFANRQPVGQLDNIHWKELHQRTEEFLDRFDLDLDPRMLVKRLSMGQQQILEILKAISTNPKVLILDEPTSSLTESEIQYLFENIRKLQQQGMSFIYITHKLSEIFQIASRVIVMRDGKYIDSKNVDEVTENDLVSMMVGRQITNLYGTVAESDQKEVYFRVEDFARKGAFEKISFELRRGEILGFAGLVGAGRTEVGRAIFGIDPKDAGRVFLNGKQIKIRNPESAIENGIAYLTEDRKGTGLFLGMTVRENVIAPSLKQFSSRYGFLRGQQIDKFAQLEIDTYSIHTDSIFKKVLNLSGGNQQKCLVAMWMGIKPQVIIFDEPTRGVDVGARAEIYRKLREFAEQGVGIIMISSDLPELIGMCDRVLVMHQGKIKGELMKKDFSEELILSYAAGLDNETNQHSMHVGTGEGGQSGYDQA
jgi:ABC-type sugar transport system ATPase subunit